MCLQSCSKKSKLAFLTSKGKIFKFLPCVRRSVMGYFHIGVNIVVCAQASELRHLASESEFGPAGVCVGVYLHVADEFCLCALVDLPES